MTLLFVHLVRKPVSTQGTTCCTRLTLLLDTINTGWSQASVPIWTAACGSGHEVSNWTCTLFASWAPGPLHPTKSSPASLHSIAFCASIYHRRWVTSPVAHLKPKVYTLLTHTCIAIFGSTHSTVDTDKCILLEYCNHLIIMVTMAYDDASYTILLDTRFHRGRNVGFSHSFIYTHTIGVPERNL